jgi:hypothetical protein
VKAARFILTIFYASYLLNVGITLLVVPWSELWPLVVLRCPPPLAAALDQPAVKGAISAFGFLHLALVVVELIGPPTPSSRRP